MLTDLLPSAKREEFGAPGAELPEKFFGATPSSRSEKRPFLLVKSLKSYRMAFF